MELACNGADGQGPEIYWKHDQAKVPEGQCWSGQGQNLGLQTCLAEETECHWKIVEDSERAKSWNRGFSHFFWCLGENPGDAAADVDQGGVFFAGCQEFL